jgi:hypothetical protein
LKSQIKAFKSIPAKVPELFEKSPNCRQIANYLPLFALPYFPEGVGGLFSMSMKIFREINFQKFQIFNPSAALAILLGVGGLFFNEHENFYL